MGTKKDYGVSFVNIDLRFKSELYLNESERFPEFEPMMEWVGGMVKDYYRVGISYSERTNSVTVSFTYKGGKPDDTPPCLTFHSNSVYGALKKHYLVFEIFQAVNEGFKFAEGLIQQTEDRIEIALERLK